ncbi:MAG TPA: FMN-binding protein [Acidobacteria bacterium]|nr:FMN-binding protein [Acidobacteriota bacterium]
MRDALRRLGGVAVQVHAPGVARVAVGGHLPGAQQRRLSGRRQRCRDLRRAVAPVDESTTAEDIDAVSRATITVTAATRAIRQGARLLAREFLAEQASDT